MTIISNYSSKKLSSSLYFRVRQSLYKLLIPSIILSSNPSNTPQMNRSFVLVSNCHLIPWVSNQLSDLFPKYITNKISDFRSKLLPRIFSITLFLVTFFLSKSPTKTPTSVSSYNLSNFPSFQPSSIPSILQSSYSSSSPTYSPSLLPT